ncbi:DUF6007 family protein [Marinococcus halophilus]|uniref:DUF6007 family protein n=1 Tax=Marinococcus halophilus TaxID=1371 RepID=UPI0009A73388|nr:DUF6007 family protein [Marinococcus halophilus]
MDNEKETTKQALDRMTLYDFLYVLPMFFLFFYFPSDRFWQVIVNFIIIILVGFGLAYATHTVVYLYNRSKYK